MKAQVAGERAGSGERPAPAMEKQAATGEFPAVSDEAAGEEDEDVFKEIPTVANRANATVGPSSGGAGASPLEGQHDGAGSYRLVRPTTSDVIDPPAAAKGDATAARRLVIGTARKPR